ncbi:hypothetical protein [Lentzea sp. NPDC060358]|uniref:hypothetical protein n=1 Tax=Lentzea sp. NPDC060358 TaxID=3347103 RepID=UPI003646058F
MRLVIAASVIAVAACSPTPPEPAPSPPPTSTASTPDLVKAMDAKVKSALMPIEELGIPAEHVTDEPKWDAELAISDGKLSAVCLGARVDVGVSTSRKRIWYATTYVEEQVFGLVGVSAKHVLDTVRAKARSCQTYNGANGEPPREVVADVDIPEWEGVDDTYALCEDVPEVAEGEWRCEAFVARGDLIAKVVVGDAGETKTRSSLTDVVQYAVPYLVKAG